MNEPLSVLVVDDNRSAADAGCPRCQINAAGVAHGAARGSPARLLAPAPDVVGCLSTGHSICDAHCAIELLYNKTSYYYCPNRLQLTNQLV